MYSPARQKNNSSSSRWKCFGERQVNRPASFILERRVQVLKQRQVSPYDDEVQPRIVHVLEAGHGRPGLVADAKLER